MSHREISISDADCEAVNRRRCSERGIALIIVLLSMLLLSALGIALSLTTSTETQIAASYRRSTETFYAADAGAARAIHDLALVGDWTDVLSGGETSTFVDGAPGPRVLPDGSPFDMTTHTMRRGLFGLALLGLVVSPREAAAQLDPLLFLKRPYGTTATSTVKPNVLVAVDTAIRMQRDTNGDYRDANPYKYGDPILSWETALGIIPGGNTIDHYRRKYVGLTEPSSSPHGFTTDHIEIVGDRDFFYSTFDEYTRIAIARRGLIEAVTRNSSVARFGLIRTRQNNPRYLTPASADAWTYSINESPVTALNPA